MNLSRRGLAPRAAAVTLSAALLLAAGGCSASGTKAGPNRPPVTLRLATVENAGAEYIDAVRGFAAEVARLTGGSVTIQLNLEADFPWTAHSEQVVTDMVRNGRTDLALVPPRVFDTVGIHGFEALQTPMLIDSPELAGAITTGSIAADLLAGLSGDGLIGLGLFYDGLRRPLAVHGAVTTAGQFDTLLIRVPISGVAFEMFRALGAVPDGGTSHAVATTGARYPAAETQLEIADSDFPAGSTITANMVFYPKFNALLANPGAFNRLTRAQQDALRQAASATAAGAVDTTADDEARAETFCEGGGHVVLAAESEIEKMQATFEPVVDRLLADPASGPLIREIETLKVAVATPGYRLPPACAPRSGDGAKLPTTPPPPSP